MDEGRGIYSVAMFQNKRQLRKQLPFVLGSGRRRRPPPFGI